LETPAALAISTIVGRLILSPRAGSMNRFTKGEVSNGPRSLPSPEECSPASGTSCRPHASGQAGAAAPGVQKRSGSTGAAHFPPLPLSCSVSPKQRRTLDACVYPVLHACAATTPPP